MSLPRLLRRENLPRQKIEDLTKKISQQPGMESLLCFKREDETLDSFYHGKILILQKKKGYRFSVDAPILADFIETKENEELLEIGAGCGIISLLLSLKPFKHITCLEIQSSLADLARRNVFLNRLKDKITVIAGDIKFYQPGKKFDVIFANPPYFKLKSGLLGRCKERTIARHEIALNALELIKKIVEFLKTEGRCCLIYPFSRYKEIMKLLAKHGLKIWRERLVLSKIDRPPRFFLIEAGFIEKPKKEIPTLILFGPDGQYKAEAKKIFAGPEIEITPDEMGRESRA